MIALDNVSKQYHYDNSAVLEGVTMSIPYGITTLLVDIQSGKSTLAKLMLGLEQPTAGSILVLGASAGVCRDIALIDSSLLLWQRKSVLYNLMYPLLVRGSSRAQARAIATEHAVHCGIEGLLSTKVGRLNTADKVEVAVARATIRQLQLVILDSLDSVCNSQQWHSIIERLGNHCSNILVLTSNCNSAVGNIMVLRNNTVTQADSMDSALQVIADGTWLYNRLGEYRE